MPGKAAILALLIALSVIPAPAMARISCPALAPRNIGAVDETPAPPITKAEGAQSGEGTAIKNGDWVLYRISMDYSEGEKYVRGSATVKLVFYTDSQGEVIDYRIVDAGIESLEASGFNTSDAEEQMMEVAGIITGMAPPYTPPDQLSPDGIYEPDLGIEGVSVRAEYDTSTGVLRRARLGIDRGIYKGDIGMEAIDSSIPGIVAGGGALAVGGGLLYMVLVAAVIAAAAAAAVLVVVRRRSRRAPPQQPQAPPIPPPPPPR